MIKVDKPWDNVPFGNGGSFKISVGAIRKTKMYINQLQHDDITHTFTIACVDDCGQQMR